MSKKIKILLLLISTVLIKQTTTSYTPPLPPLPAKLSPYSNFKPYMNRLTNHLKTKPPDNELPIAAGIYHPDLGELAIHTNKVEGGGGIIKDNRKNNNTDNNSHHHQSYHPSSLNHAELLCITSASKLLNKWRLKECTLIITEEPCIMCVSAILLSRIGRVVYRSSSGGINTGNRIGGFGGWFDVMRFGVDEVEGSGSGFGGEGGITPHPYRRDLEVVASDFEVDGVDHIGGGEIREFFKWRRKEKKEIKEKEMRKKEEEG